MFPKAIQREPLVEILPGPGTYDIKANILSVDPNKHYGFIDKAKRFKSPKTADKSPEIENINPEKPVKPAPITKPQRIEDLGKIKAELEKSLESYQRLQMSHEKDIGILEDRLIRVDSQLQNTLKENSSLLSSCTVKEKEISDLQHKESKLRAGMDKNERQISSLQEKIAQIPLIQKKLEDAERMNSKFKTIIERKTVDEQMIKDKVVLEKRIASLQKECELIKNEYNDTREAMKRDHEVNMKKEHEKFKESLKRDHEKTVSLYERKLNDKDTEFLFKIKEKDSQLSFKTQENSQLVASYDEQLKTIRSDFERHKKHLNEILSQQKHELNMQRKQNDVLKHDYEKHMNSSSLDLARLQASINSLKIEKNELKDQIASLKDQMKRDHTYYKEVESQAHQYKDQILENEHLIKSYNECMDMSKQEILEKDQTIAQKEQYISQIQDQFRRDITLSKSEIDQLKSSKSKDDEYLHTQINQLQSCIVQVLPALASLALADLPDLSFDDLSQTSKLLFIEYSNKIREIIHKHDDLKQMNEEKIDRLESDCLKFEDEINELFSIQQQLETECQTHEESIRNLESSYSELSNNYHHLEQQFLQLGHEKNQSDINLVSSLGKVSELEKQLRVEEAKIVSIEQDSSTQKSSLDMKIQDLESRIEALVRDNQQHTVLISNELESKGELERQRRNQEAKLNTVEAEYQETRCSLIELQHLYESLEMTLVDCQDEKASTMESLNAIEQEYSLLQTTFSQSQSEKQSITESLHLLENEYSALESKLLVVEEDNQIVRSKLTETEEMIHHARQDISEKENIIYELETTITHLQNNEAHLNQTISEMNKALDSIEQELEITKTERNEATETNILLTSSLQESNSHLDENHHLITSLESALNEKTEFGFKLESLLNESRNKAVALESNLEEKNQMIQQFENEIESIRREFKQQTLSNENTVRGLLEQESRVQESLRIEISKTQRLQSDYETLESDFQEYKTQTESLIQTKNETLSAYESSDFMKQEQINGLNDKLAESKLTFDQYFEETQECIQTLRDKNIFTLHSCQDEIDSMNQAFEKEQEEYQRVESQVIVLSENIVHLESQLKVLDNEKLRIVNEYEEYRTQSLETNQLMKSDYENRVNQLSIELSNKCEEYNDSKIQSDNEIRNLLNSQDSLLESLQEKEDMISKLQESIHNHEQERDSFEQGMFSMSGRIQEQDEKMVSMQERFDKERMILSSRIEEMKLIVDQKATEVQEMNRWMNDKEREIKSLDSEIEQRDIKLDDMTALIESKEDSIDAINCELSDALQLMEGLKQEYETSERERLEALESLVCIEKKVNDYREIMSVERANTEKTIQSMQEEFMSKIDSSLQLKLEAEQKKEEIAIELDNAIKAKQEAENALRRKEIMHANELAGRNLQAKYLEDKLREKSMEVECNRGNATVGDKLKAENKTLKAALDDLTKRFSRLEKENEEFKKKSSNKSNNVEKHNQDLIVQISELKSKYAELMKSKEQSVKTMEEMIIDLNKKIAVVEAKDRIASEELQKVADFNGEAFGHHNPKQKIKHVSQIKNENVLLRQDKTGLEQLNIDYRKRIATLERELENVKSDPVLGKKVARFSKFELSTAVKALNLESESMNDLSVGEFAIVPFNDLSNKEN